MYLLYLLENISLTLPIICVYMGSIYSTKGEASFDGYREQGALIIFGYICETADGCCAQVRKHRHRVLHLSLFHLLQGLI
jgi:hypothetical protein